MSDLENIYFKKINTTHDLKQMLLYDEWAPLNVLQTIFDGGKEKEFLKLLKKKFKSPTYIQTQNFLFYEKNYIFKNLGIEG